MKYKSLGITNIVAGITAIALVFFASCKLTPQQQAALTGIENIAFKAGIGYLSGGKDGAVQAGSTALADQLQAGTLGLRSAEAPGLLSAPTTAAITAAVIKSSGDPVLGAALGKLAPIIANTVAANLPASASPAVKTQVVNAAIESAAVGLDKAASTP